MVMNMGILAAIMQIMDITDMKKATPETVIALAVFTAEKEEREKDNEGNKNEHYKF